MALRVIGAGVGRTGTTSLKLALERLLDGRCYHMYEVFRNRPHIPQWHAAIRGELPDWDALFEGYAATVDWPAAAFWQPLSEAFPDAVVLLSVRSSPDAWFRSASETINELLLRRPSEENEAWHAMALELLKTTFAPVPFERARAVEAYEAHNDAVRATVPSNRLLEWRVDDGWAPLCDRLGLPVPDEPFPRTNTREEFHAFLERMPEPPSRLERLKERLGRLRARL